MACPACPVDPLNTPTMYRVRPYFQIKKVKLPDCMYLMTPVSQLFHDTSNAQDTGAILSCLENRQERVLSNIGKLQENVESLAEKLRVGPAEAGISQQNSSKRSLKDVVISCPISTSPDSIFIIYQYISGCIPAACRVHVHSSASTSATEDMKRYLDGFPSSPDPVLRVILIWKDESQCSAPTMVVSPHDQTPVEGEANISRYLCREYFSTLYEDGGRGPEAVSQIDSWLDAVSTMLQRGSAKEKSSVLRRFNSQLGSTRFLVGEDPSLADIVSYCVLCKQSGLKLTGNVKQWLKRVQASLPRLVTVQCPYLTNESSLKKNFFY